MDSSQTTGHPSGPSRPLLAVLVLTFAVISVIAPMKLRKKSELGVYTKGAQRMVEGKQIYRPNDPPAFTYPPFFALPFTALLPLTPATRTSIWWFTNLCLVTACIWLVVNMLQPMFAWKQSTPRQRRWATGLIAILSARFVISPLEYQSHDLIVFLFFLLSVRSLLAQSDVAGGVWAGLATACKATPLLLLPVLFLQKRYRPAVTMVLVIVVATLIPDLVFPHASGRLWVASWYGEFVSKVSVAEAASADGAWTRWNALNQSISGTTYRLGTPVETGGNLLNVAFASLSETSIRRTTLGLEFAVLILIAWAARPRRKVVLPRPVSDFLFFGQAGCVLCGMLLLSPMSSTQHFCVLLAPISFCVTHWILIRRTWAVSTGLLLMFFMGTLGAQDLSGAVLADWMQAVGNSTWCAFACLITSGYIISRESRGHHSGSIRIQEPVTDTAARRQAA